MRKSPLSRAYEKGKDAHARGMSDRSNPYADKPQANGAATYSRAFKNQWQKGWLDYKKKESA